MTVSSWRVRLSHHRALRGPIAYVRDYLTALGEGRAEIPVVVAIILVTSLLDIIGLALVPLFIGALTGEAEISRYLPEWIQGGPRRTVVPALGALLVSVYFFKSAILLALNHKILQFGERRRAVLTARLYEALLRKPYLLLVDRGPSEAINDVTLRVTHYAYQTLVASVRLAADFIVIVALIAFLAFIDFRAIVLLLLMLVVAAYLYNVLIRHRVSEAGRQVTESSRNIVALVTESLRAAREIVILKRAAPFVARLNDEATELAAASASHGFLSLVPRQLVEVLLVIFLCAAATMAVMAGETAQLLATLATFGAAAVRVGPSATAILSNYSNLKFSRSALREVSRLLLLAKASAEAAHPAAPPIKAPFRMLELVDATFSYPESATRQLKGVSLTVRQGEFVAIVGASGSGKTTLLNVLLGFLSIHSGNYRVNDCELELPNASSWHDLVGFVPQEASILEGTVATNVALGEEIDEARLLEALRRARLPEAAAERRITEDGANLSGGQRQRVAIARALYMSRDVLVVDEATSALDQETGMEIVTDLRNLCPPLTVIMVTHDPTLASLADRVYRLADGHLYEVDGTQLQASRGAVDR